MGQFDLKKLTLPPEGLKLISELDQFKARWATTQALSPDRLTALRQVATIESVGSSTRIEGVKLTNTEVEALLRGIKTYSFRSRDEQEVAGYAEVMELIFASYSEIPITENHIKQLHRALLKHSTKDEHHRGEYKKFPNNVEAFDHEGKSVGVIFQTPSPFDTPPLMTELTDWVNTEIKNDEYHPLLIIAIYVDAILKIHPFQDGNGRLSRVLTTLLLLRAGYSYVPYSSFERVIEENKSQYYLCLRNAQAELENAHPKSHPKVHEWIQFFLRSMQKQKRALETKLTEELAALALPPLSLQIIELIKSRGPSAVADIVAITHANRNTVKAHLKRLTNDHVLTPEGVGRGVRYRMKG